MLDKHILCGFCGTENYHRWSALFPAMLMTDGTLYVAQNGGESGAFWLMDAIASHQRKLLKHDDERLHEMQFWKLTVVEHGGHKGAVLECRADSDEKPVIQQHIEFTDFDLPEIELWVGPASVGGRKVQIVLLPSEY